jgi:acyl-CoA synthetase (NDP forming)
MHREAGKIEQVAFCGASAPGSDSMAFWELDRLARLFRPGSVAIVGANERNVRYNGILDYMRDSGVPLYLVNSQRDEVAGQKCVPSLAAIGGPVDAVLCLVNASVTLDVVEQAASLGCGGAIVTAAGFAEAGKEGAERQARLNRLSAGFPILGPNCNGFTDFVRRVKLSPHPPVRSRPGSVGVVTHSGGMLAPIALDAFERAVGLSFGISVGNEATLDMGDCIDFLAADPGTKVIALVMEGIRRPDAFMQAVARAAAAGKPVVALKLARGEKAREISRSHTASIVDEAWIYDAAFKQAGIIVADSISDLVDRVAAFDQLAPTRWSAAGGLALLTTSGGGAGLAADRYGRAGFAIAEFPSVEPAVKKFLPGATVVNPLDMSGFAVVNAEMRQSIFRAYLESPEVDSVVFQWMLDDDAKPYGGAMLDDFIELAGRSGKTAALCSIESSALSDWAAGLPSRGLAVFKGPESAIRALSAMREFMAFRAVAKEPAATPAMLPVPADADFVDSDVGSMLRFAAAMKLLSSLGIQVAEHRVVATSEPAEHVHPPFDGPYVVKLADVPHRTELGAVQFGVGRRDLVAAIEDLRTLARKSRVPADVAIQKQLKLKNEAFVGAKTGASLGSAVVFGAGGIFVEVLKQVSGVVVPFARTDVARAIEGSGLRPFLEGFRGLEPWNREKLTDIVMAVGRLAGADWLESLDINPLGFADGEFIAVDCLCTRRPLPHQYNRR